jgi:hypothetical protein
MDKTNWKDSNIEEISLAKEIYQLDKTKLLTIEEIDMLSLMNQEFNELDKKVIKDLLIKFYNYKGE